MSQYTLLSEMMGWIQEGECQIYEFHAEFIQLLVVYIGMGNIFNARSISSLKVTSYTSAKHQEQESNEEKKETQLMLNAC